MYLKLNSSIELYLRYMAVKHKRLCKLIAYLFNDYASLAE